MGDHRRFVRLMVDLGQELLAGCGQVVYGGAFGGAGIVAGYENGFISVLAHLADDFFCHRAQEAVHLGGDNHAGKSGHWVSPFRADTSSL